MHRIDAPGATGSNLFTEGNPALGIPATEVSDDWLNDVQEEIVTVIEDQGISLVKGQQDQLLTAILGLIGQGGKNIKLDPLQNNTANQTVTDLVFDKSVTKAAFILVDVHRQTDTENEQEMLLWSAVYDPADDVWRITTMMSSHDNSGTTPTITSAGQVEANTDDLAGANYDGQLRVAGVIEFKL